MIRPPQGLITLNDLNELMSTANVGIGPTNPTERLEITQLNDLGGLKLNGFSIPSAYFKFYINNQGNPRFNTNYNMVFETPASIYFRTGSNMWFNDADAPANSSILMAYNGGSVGIGRYPICKLDVDGAIRCKSYTVATVPSAALGAGQIIYVSDDVGGAVLAFSDGTNWRRVTDRAIISTT
jgi:hypothetical protein